VQALDNLLGWNADGADEERGLFLNDDVNELVQLALLVVIVGLAGASADLGKQKIDAELAVWVFQVRLELVNLVGGTGIRTVKHRNGRLVSDN
jgi:hypothetical protein